MSKTLRVAALAAGLQDAPVPAAISLVKDNGVLKFCDDDGHSLYGGVESMDTNRTITELLA